MRVAALYDIHGNLPALEAVLAEVRESRADTIVVGGDVLPGPMPRECIQLLRESEIPIHCIFGNGEVAALTELSGGLSAVPQPYRGIIRWCAEQLDAEDAQWIRDWPKTFRMNIDTVGQVSFCHATPRDENEIFVRTTADEPLLPAFTGVDSTLVVCGHTHMQFDRMVGSVRVVNAGSIGMPFGEAGADWLLLGPDVELRHTAYDFAEAAERICRSAYPQADDFAENNILHPPSAAKMLEIFARAEIK